MDGLTLLSLALATAYWSYALSRTKGAFGVFKWMRKRLPLGGLLTCPVCLSIWLALGLWMLLPTPARALVNISAVAGAATLLGYYTGTWQQPDD